MKSNREVKERKIGKVFYVSEEVFKEIFDIYQSHNCDDDSACKAEDRLGEFMMRLKSKKSYTEDELLKAAKGGYDNGITDMKRKLKGLRAKISKLDKSFHEGIGAESMRFDVLLLVDELLSKEFNR